MNNETFQLIKNNINQPNISSQELLAILERLIELAKITCEHLADKTSKTLWEVLK